MAGTKFHADAIEDAFIQVDNPDNRISPIEILTFEDHHELLFDLKTKNAYDGRWNLPVDPEGTTYIWVRNLYSLDPEGMRQLIQNGYSNLDWSRHFFNISLPIVQIDGIDFLVDPLKEAFREKENPWNFMQFKYAFERDTYGYYFDRKAKNMAVPHDFNIDGPLEKLPPHIVFAKIPSGEELADMCRTIEAIVEKRKKEQM